MGSGGSDQRVTFNLMLEELIDTNLVKINWISFLARGHRQPEGSEVETLEVPSSSRKKVMGLEMPRMKMKWRKKEAAILGKCGFSPCSQSPDNTMPLWLLLLVILSLSLLL